MTGQRPGDRLIGERGTGEVLGLVLITPLVVAVALIVVFVGRRVDVAATVRSAAAAGAQAAVLERSPAAANAAARIVTTRMLEATPTCASVRVEVDTGAFRPGGSVTVTAVCAVEVSGVESVTGRPTWSMSSAAATVDPYRWMQR